MLSGVKIILPGRILIKEFERWCWENFERAIVCLFLCPDAKETENQSR
jgi:hypothetical protein